MTTKNRQLALQWAQLTALAAVHFLADVFMGMMHSVLPGIQAEFGLNMLRGAILLGVFNFAANWVQVFTGHMRPERTTPLFMYLGLMFAAVICLLAVLPRGVESFGLMLVLAAVCGGGIATIHPEALRAIHALDRISPATSTAVFMIGGILGFALGGKYCTELVTHFGGVKGLFPLAVCPILCIPIVLFLKVRLAVEPAGDPDSHSRRDQGRLSFWPIMVMATLAGISTCTIVWIVPQKLALDGFELTFGGYTVMMFSLGGGAGAFFWATAANRFGDLLCTLVSILLGVFLMAGYSVLISHQPAVWLLFAASFCAFGSYPLMVSIARGTSGPRFGRRMALMVGGTWGIASLFPVFLAPVAEHYGAETILLWGPAGYIAACVVCLCIMLQIRATDTRVLARRQTCQ